MGTPPTHKRAHILTYICMHKQAPAPVYAHVWMSHSIVVCMCRLAHIYMYTAHVHTLPLAAEEVGLRPGARVLMLPPCLGTDPPG
jgi:hypothetical protein